jgi:hypothetical protein
MEVIVMEENYLFKTQKQMLLEMIAISGEYPTENINRLIPAPSYSKKIITKLIGKGLIKTIYKNGVRGYRLAIKGKRQLMAENPARFEGIFEGDVDTNKFRSDLPRRLRLHSLAQVYTLMLNAEICILQDIKPMMFDFPSQSLGKLSENNLPIITEPCFYSSREQKGGIEESNAIEGSRAAGTLLTQTHAYAVYNTCDSQITWGEKVEQRYKAEVNNNLQQMSRLNQYSGGEVGGILIGESMESFERYLTAKKKKGSGLSFLANAYSPFYYITNDVCGEGQLKLLCDVDKMTKINEDLIARFNPPNTSYPIPHDALTEDGNPVLFCYLLNIPRLLRFFNGLSRHKKIGLVIALDFQIKVLQRYVGDIAKFKRLTLH